MTYHFSLGCSKYNAAISGNSKNKAAVIESHFLSVDGSISPKKVHTLTTVVVTRNQQTASLYETITLAKTSFSFIWSDLQLFQKIPLWNPTFRPSSLSPIHTATTNSESPWRRDKHDCWLLMLSSVMSRLCCSLDPGHKTFQLGKSG